MALDPLLKAFEDKILYLQVFGEQVAESELEKGGNLVRAQTAEDYIRFVAQTFLSLGAMDLRYADNYKNKIDFCIN